MNYGENGTKLVQQEVYTPLYWAGRMLREDFSTEVHCAQPSIYAK